MAAFIASGVGVDAQAFENNAVYVSPTESLEDVVAVSPEYAILKLRPGNYLLQKAIHLKVGQQLMSFSAKAERPHLWGPASGVSIYLNKDVRISGLLMSPQAGKFNRPPSIAMEASSLQGRLTIDENELKAFDDGLLIEENQSNGQGDALTINLHDNQILSLKPHAKCVSMTLNQKSPLNFNISHNQFTGEAYALEISATSDAQVSGVVRDNRFIAEQQNAIFLEAVSKYSRSEFVFDHNDVIGSHSVGSIKVLSRSLNNALLSVENNTVKAEENGLLVFLTSKGTVQANVMNNHFSARQAPLHVSYLGQDGQQVHIQDNVLLTTP